MTSDAIVQLGVTTKTVLGTVIGTKTLDGQWAGKSKSVDDRPPVATKPMSGEAVTTIAEKPKAPDVKPEPPPKPKVEPPPKTGVKPKPAPSADADEKKARRLLRMVDNYLAAGMKVQALKKLNEIIEKYPKTEAGKEAVKKSEGL